MSRRRLLHTLKKNHGPHIIIYIYTSQVEMAADFWTNNESTVLKWVFPKIVYHPIIHCNRAFQYEPSILGYSYCWKHPNASGVPILFPSTLQVGVTVAEHWNGRSSSVHQATSAPKPRLMRKVEENGVTWHVGKRMLHRGTPQETNISHLWQRKIIFKHAWKSGGYVSFREFYQLKNWMLGRCSSWWPFFCLKKVGWSFVWVPWFCWKGKVPGKEAVFNRTPFLDQVVVET